MSSPPDSIPTFRKKDDDAIRARLLHRLGIYSEQLQPQQPMTAAQHRRLRILRGMGVGHHTMHPSPPDGSAIRLPLDGVQPFREKLKADYDEDEEGLTSDDALLSTSATRKIAFQDEVQVMPIPTRYEYSDRIKSRIWSNRHELQENAERNALEFAAEGWNWQTVTEDEGMFICSVSGELVHPIHLQGLSHQEEEQKGGLERGSPVH